MRGARAELEELLSDVIRTALSPKVRGKDLKMVEASLVLSLNMLDWDMLEKYMGAVYVAESPLGFWGSHV